MDQFLKYSKASLENLTAYDTVHVVTGNESCDLDSAISALVYGYLLYEENATVKLNKKETVLSILNVTKDGFPVKTEVTYFLSRNNISFEDLIFKDEIDLHSIQEQKKLKLYLVDHHVLPSDILNLKSSVVEILDHRPQDPEWTWSDIKCTIELVGCCCTLVAREILKRNPDVLSQEIGNLLYGTIVLDTVNFSSSAARSKPLDIEITEILEKKCAIGTNRTLLFNDLLAARTDISSLTSLQLLFRDLKIVKNVAFPGLPILIKDFVRREDAVDALNKFIEIKKPSVIISMGLIVVNNEVIRDLAVYTNTDCQLADLCVSALLETKAPSLELEIVPTNIQRLQLFSQKNIKMTRKQILPIIQKCVEKISSV